jgi:uncharacterized protein (DUF2345 family)
MTDYDSITASTEKIQYSANVGLYPEADTISILGPVWLPRIYGKDLTAFEIASSGKIAITINDVHSLDISKVGQLTTLSTKNNDSLEYNVNAGAMKMNFDSTLNNVSLYADCNISQTASNDFSITAHSNILFLASNGSLALSSQKSNMTLVMDDTTKKTTLYSSNDIVQYTSNNFILNTINNINAFAISGSVRLAGSTSNTLLTLNGINDNIEMYSSNDTTITSSNNITVTSCNNIDIGSTQIGTTTLYASNVSFALNGSALTTSLYSSNDITFSTSNNSLWTTRSNVTLTTVEGRVKLASYTDKSYLLLNNKDGHIFTSNNFDVSASNDVTNTAQNQVELKSINGNFSVVGHDGKMSLLMNSSNDRVYLFGSNGVDINSSNNMNLTTKDGAINLLSSTSINDTATTNFVVSADNGKMNLNMDATSHNMYIDTKSNLEVTASNEIIMYGLSNVNVRSSNIRIASMKNAVYSASNDINVAASNDLHLSASNTLSLAAKDLAFQMSGDTSFSALNKVDFFITSSVDPAYPTFRVKNDGVDVFGDLFISGTINTSNINNTIVSTQTLKVEDKLVYLASVAAIGDSNPIETPFVTDGAGIQVDGVPTHAASSVDSNLWSLYEKSIKWRYGSNAGTSNLGTDTYVNESAWEVCGGGMRIVRRKNISGSIRDLSFTFRVGAADELELVKTWWNATSSSYVSKRVARFGRII